ncbi:MAG TPA: S41 family peptidase [Nannocystaceae bacterium]|nr:S41 family peptidase [Nannocystaceae bacterium]
MQGRRRGMVGLGLALLTGAVGCGDDPFDFGGPRSCEIPDQNAWVYHLMQEAYLFADDLPVVDPVPYEEPALLIADLRVDPDRWSRVSDRVRTDALFEEGKSVGLGFRTGTDAMGRLVIAFVNDGSPASAAGMKRGDIVQTIAGLSVDEIETDNRWSEVYGTNDPGVTVNLSVTPPHGEVREVSLVKDWIEIVTVPITTVLPYEGRNVGYLVFSTFVDTAPAELDAAFETFKAAGVRDVIVDLRYNGGGRIAVARHLVDLLVGDVAKGDTSYAVHYGPGLADQDTARGIDRLSQSIEDPRRIVFITTRSTLSASELVINAVRPHADVSVVGGTTGGKPVGSHQWPFCDKIAQPITFELVNADDQGGYYEGFTPSCEAPDDLAHALGDPDEASLRQALHVVATGDCAAPPPPGSDANGNGDLDMPAPDDAPRRMSPAVNTELDELRGWF